MRRRKRLRDAVRVLAVALALAAIAQAHGQDQQHADASRSVQESPAPESAPPIEVEILANADSRKDPLATTAAVDTDRRVPGPAPGGGLNREAVERDILSARSELAHSVSHREMFFHYLGEIGLHVRVSDYVTVSYEQWGELWEALEAALLATYEFFRLWVIFLYLLSIPLLQLLAKLVEALLPHFLTGVQMIAEYIWEMDPIHQAVLALVAVLTIICYRQGYAGKAKRRYVTFRRDMRQRYRAFVGSLSEKSRMAALALPHLVFLVLVYVVVFLSPAIVLDIWDNQALTVVLSVGIPLARSIQAIHRRRLQRARSQRDGALTTAPTPVTTSVRSRPSAATAAYNEWRPYEACLKYWVLWSIAVCMSGIVSLFVPGFVLAYVSLPTYWLNILLTWMHSPVARGDIALYALLSPLVNPYANRIKDVIDDATGEGGAANEHEATNFMMRALVTFGVVRQQHVHLLKDMWSQGPALAGLMFIFTPGFVAARGSLLIGFGFPAYVTMGALADKRTRNYEWWLLYFSVTVIVDYLVTAVGSSFSWLPLFYHVKLLAMMWLQFPYFRGARKIFDTTMSSVFVATREAPATL